MDPANLTTAMLIAVEDPSYSLSFGLIVGLIVLIFGLIVEVRVTVIVIDQDLHRQAASTQRGRSPPETAQVSLCPLRVEKAMHSWLSKPL